MPRKRTETPAASGSRAGKPDSGAAAGDDELAALAFETAVAELEALVDQMEAGDMTLEASLIAYERGVKLARHCQNALHHAELKVSKLTEDDQLEPLDPDEVDDDQ